MFLQGVPCQCGFLRLFLEFCEVLEEKTFLAGVPSELCHMIAPSKAHVFLFQMLPH